MAQKEKYQPRDFFQPLGVIYRAIAVRRRHSGNKVRGACLMMGGLDNAGGGGGLGKLSLMPHVNVSSPSQPRALFRTSSILLYLRGFHSLVLLASFLRCRPSVGKGGLVSEPTAHRNYLGTYVGGMLQEVLAVFKNLLGFPAHPLCFPALLCRKLHTTGSPHRPYRLDTSKFQARS